MRKLFALSAALTCVLMAGVAHADTIYNLTLTSTSGNAGNGTGSIDLNVAPSTATNSQSTYTPAGLAGDVLKGLSFTIGGDSFSLANATSNYGLVQFTSGQLSDITYQGSSNNGAVILNFSANGLSYNFSDSGKAENGTGMISASLAPVATTPEPTSLALLGTGLAAGVAALRRKRLA